MSRYLLSVHATSSLIFTLLPPDHSHSDISFPFPANIPRNDVPFSSFEKHIRSIGPLCTHYTLGRTLAGRSLFASSTKSGVNFSQVMNTNTPFPSKYFQTSSSMQSFQLLRALTLSKAINKMRNTICFFVYCQISLLLAPKLSFGHLGYIVSSRPI